MCPGRALRLLLVAGLTVAMIGTGASGAVADEHDDGDELCPEAGIPADQISINMFTLAGEIGFGEPSVEELEDIFAQLGEAGYRTVEPFGQPYGLDASSFSDLMAEEGIRAASSHSDIPLDDGELDVDAYTEIAEYAAALGQDYICSGFPPGGGDALETYGSTMQTAALVDQMGEIAVEAGVEGGYLVHNHADEFEYVHEDVDGDGEEKTGWELLVENTDPDHVGFQLDTYWAGYAGEDSVELIETYGDRISMLHVKDGTVDSESSEITQLGQGDIDFQAVFEAAWEHVDYDAYEFDQAPDAYELAAGGFESMNCSSSGTTHAHSIHCLAALDIVRGLGDGTYDPRGDVTRGQLAPFVTRSIERATGETMEVGDADLPDIGGPNSAHGQAIRKLANAGIVRGYEDGNFRPSDPVSRDQAACYVSGAVEHLLGEPLPTSGAGISDVTPGSQYAADIDQMVTADIIDGYPDGTFRPREPISRGQMAKLIANAIQVSADGGVWAG